MHDNITMMQYFDWYLANDGLWWRRCAAQAPVLKNCGISQVWLPPAFKGISQDNVGYSVYDTYDLGEFDQKGTVRTKYGTVGEYKNAVAALQKEGIKVFADIVLNQRMGADRTEEVDAVEVAEDNRLQKISDPEKILAWTAFDFAGRNNTYSDFKWNHTHFSGVDFDERTGKHAIYLLDGKEWNSEVDPENGSFDYLMGADVDTDNPEVIEQTRKWLLWYYNEIHMDGFRLDAVKHISFEFYRDLISYVRQNGCQDVPMVGEYWSADVGRLTHYLDVVENQISLFDAPLHYNFFNASNSGGNFPMRSLLQNTLVAQRPDRAVTFVENHDTEPGQALESSVMLWFKPIAYAAILLRKDGIPCVFYSDYYGYPPMKLERVANLDQMLRIRRDYAYGDEKDYFDDDNVVGWVRYGDEEHTGSGLAVVMSDGAGGTKHMEMGTRWSGVTFYDALGVIRTPVTIGQDGWGDFSTDGGNVSVWLTADAYAKINITSI